MEILCCWDFIKTIFKMLRYILLHIAILLFPKLSLSQIYNSSTPNSIDAMSRSVRADNLVRSGQYEEALLEYDNILESSPDYVDGYMRRAILLSRLGRLTEAVQDYNSARQLDPYVVEVFDIHGRINKMKVLKDVSVKNPEDAGKALLEIETKLKNDPNNAGLLFVSANLKVLLGRYQDAIEDFSRAVILKPDYTEAIYNRGIAFVIVNNKTMACEDFYRSGQLGSERAFKKYALFCKK